MKGSAVELQPRGADWRQVGDERWTSGASGRVSGMSGGLPVRAVAFILLFFVAICTVNALSILDEAARAGHPSPKWVAFGLEYSSLLGMTVALGVALAIERTLRRGGPLRRAVTIIAGSLLFSATHLVVMITIRHLFWLTHGEDYRFHVRAEWFYEYRKDVLSYALMLIAIAVDRRLRSTAAANAPLLAGPRVATLRDGSRSVRFSVDDLHAVEGGGNYVELIFSGGRRRLLRATLSATEAMLRPMGFRRTHRSWLVSLAHVRRLETTRSGDYRVLLPDDIPVPLSRRSVEALAAIRERLAGEALT